MSRKMVISSLAVYTVILSCFTLLVGRTFATTSIPSEVKTDKRSQKTFKSDKNYISPRVVPDSVREPNETHSYYAFFDPEIGKTRKFNVVYDNDVPSIVPQRNMDYYVRRRRLRNFISRDILRDSEMEVRIHFNGVTAKETMISAGVDEETGKRQGLKLRQLTDGKNFIQLIYNMEDEIQDCEFIRRKDLVDNFLKEFRHDVEKAKVAYEVNVGEAEGYPDDEEYFEDDEGGIESYFGDEGQLETSNSPYEMRNITFEIIERDEDFPRDIVAWMNYPALKKSCKRTQRNLKKLVHHSQNGDLESKERLERKKRDLMDVFRMPGTKWCGKGKRAARYTSLGMFSKTDKCCRVHDTMCPYWIGGFQEKYGLFNWKLNTIMHCRCDKRFRACLKMAKTGAANLVGKLFFNIVQTQCFVLKPEEVCVKTSWWGKCEKKEYKKKAYLRDNVPY